MCWIEIGRAEILPEVLSILDTLKEVLFLWRWNFWYLVAISFIFMVPDLLLSQLHHMARASESSWGALFPFIVSSVQLLLDAASIAAILGLLKKMPADSAWSAAWRSISAYTWTFFRLALLIGVITIPAVVAVKIVAYIFNSTKAEMLFHPIVYTVFLFCAVAFPGVIEEGLGPVSALKRGLKMTRKHFLFVTGCCLIPGLGEWLFRSVTALPLSMEDDTIHWTWRVLNEVISGVVGSAWIILFGSIFLRIKAGEVRSPSESFGPMV